MKLILAVSGALVISAAVGIPVAASAATLKLSADTALPGVAVKFSGSGFKAKELVTLYWKKAGGAKLVKVTASKSGTIGGSFKVPVPKGGSSKLDVVAVGASSKREAKFLFVESCTDEWTSTKGGNWSKAPDWSTGAVPGPSTAACITLPSAKKYTVVLNQLTGSTAVGSLQVGAPGGKGTQVLAMDANGSDQYLTLGHASTVRARGTFELTSAGGGSDFIEGPGTLDNYGLISSPIGKGWSRYLDGHFVNEKTGTLDVTDGELPAGQVILRGGSTFVNEGKINVAKGSEFILSGVFTQSGGKIANSGLVLASDATVNKAGGTSTGNAWQLINGTTLKDKAGTGAYTYYTDGNLSGTIPAGQTVEVYGNDGIDIQLAFEGNVTNDGTLAMTSGPYAGNGPGNAWIIAAEGTATPHLYNYGKLITVYNTLGWTKLLDVDIVNERVGVMDLNATGNTVQGEWGITNDGTLDMGAGSVLDLSGSSYGTANLIEGATATTGVTLDGAKTSVIDQYPCSASGCQTDVLTVAGKLTVATVGTAADSYFPIYSGQETVTGGFSSVPAGYTVGYNAAYTAPTFTAAGDVEITPAG